MDNGAGTLVPMSKRSEPATINLVSSGILNVRKTEKGRGLQQRVGKALENKQTRALGSSNRQARSRRFELVGRVLQWTRNV